MNTIYRNTMTVADLIAYLNTLPADLLVTGYTDGDLGDPDCGLYFDTDTYNGTDDGFLLVIDNMPTN